MMMLMKIVMMKMMLMMLMMLMINDRIGMMLILSGREQMFGDQFAITVNRCSEEDDCGWVVEDRGRGK